jgi:hypothetical protein
MNIKCDSCEVDLKGSEKGYQECPKCNEVYYKGYSLNSCLECPICNFIVSPGDMCEHLFAQGEEINSSDYPEEYNQLQDFYINDIPDNDYDETFWEKVFKDSIFEELFIDFISDEGCLMNAIARSDNFKGIYFVQYMERYGDVDIYEGLFIDEKYEKIYRQEANKLYIKAKKLSAKK